MRVLITGAAGFIGSNLTSECIKRGWDVFGVDDLSNGHEEFLPEDFRASEKFFRNDFASPRVLMTIKTQKFDAVVHLAAVPRVSYSVVHPIETNDVNVSRTLELMNACRENVGRFVFASSSSVYGGADVLPTPETHPKNPKSPYALQKSIIEDYLTLYRDLYGLESCALRFFNVFGPNQLGDSPYSTAVSAWLTAIKNNGSMRSDGDGTQSRDMCYVDNVVNACIAAASHQGTLGADRFNVACGDRTTNREVLQFLLKRYPGSKFHESSWRAGDVMHTQADVSKLKNVLGVTELVPFWDGLERTIEWYDKNWSHINKMSLRT